MSTIKSVAPSNLTQLGAWDGDTGTFWAEHADEFDRGVAAYRARFLVAAAIGDTASVLDVGCGSGQATRDAARAATAGSALGVDLSSRMIEVARQRAVNEQLTNVEFTQADAQVHSFPAQNFDVAISRHGAMFFGDPVAAFTNISRALRPGGRLVLLTWQALERNEFIHAILTALAAGREVPGPPAGAPSAVALSDPDRVRTLLTAAGFVDVQFEGLQEPMNFGPDPDSAFWYLSGHHASMLGDLDPETRTRALDDLRSSIAAHHTDQGVLYDSAAWLIEATTRRSP